jgi:hypothetical protein
MGIQLIMDGNGDTRHEFNVSVLASVALAEARFKGLTPLAGG